MSWNWTQTGWPNFRFDAAAIDLFERRFLLSSGEIAGTARHVGREDRDQLRIELLSEEAVRTSAIEGEVLDRMSVQSSLRRGLGLAPGSYPTKRREQGIAEVMMDAYSEFDRPLDQQTLFDWYRMLLSHDTSLETVGGYRQHADAMQIVSGRFDRPVVHFEAPPFDRVPEEMARFIDWFNGTGSLGQSPMPALTRAGIGHIYFESIHPFEDGNGRLGRALAEKSLAQSLGRPSLIALAHAIERDRKGYYSRLERHQKTLDITGWLVWFAQTVLAAQQITLDRIGFFIAKAHFYDLHRHHLSDRQGKAVERMFREGPDGFRGGLSAENYIAITGASRATATRDLHELSDLGALVRTGERRHTRYWLNLPDQNTPGNPGNS